MPYIPSPDLSRQPPASRGRRLRVSLQRKKCCQQIIGLDGESFSVAVCIDAKEQSVLGKMLGDAVRPAVVQASHLFYYPAGRRRR